MKNITMAVSAAVAGFVAIGIAAQVRAANDKFTFPGDYEKGVEYLSVDKPNKQVHVFYAPREASEAAKAATERRSTAVARVILIVRFLKIDLPSNRLR
jgi:hypothetical protein